MTMADSGSLKEKLRKTKVMQSGGKSTTKPDKRQSLYQSTVPSE
jgi:hypothetical protein